MNRDKLSADVASDALMRKNDIKEKLLAIYMELLEGAKFVDEYVVRAEGIAPSIEDMIQTETNNTSNEETN